MGLETGFLSTVSALILKIIRLYNYQLSTINCQLNGGRCPPYKEQTTNNKEQTTNNQQPTTKNKQPTTKETVASAGLIGVVAELLQSGLQADRF